MLIQHHVDDLAKMNEDVLEASFNKMQSTLRNLKRRGGSSQMIKLAEEEFCYLYRERERRVRRSSAHAVWLETKSRHFFR